MRFEHPTDSQIPGLKELWRAAFEDEDAFIDRFFAVAFASQRCFCAWENEEIYAAAYWFDVWVSGKKAAYLYAVATMPKHQGKGVCRRLMEAIHSHLATQGYVGAMLVPGNDSLRQMYEKMGYVNFGGIWEYACLASQTPLPLTEVDPETYARLRRQMLPAGGVLQEEENIRFLRQFYRFYKGNRVLLAASTTGYELFAAELLGDASAAPHILAALGAKSGVFRSPGDTPFAMYHPLNSQEIPRYFAFAFD